MPDEKRKVPLKSKRERFQSLAPKRTEGAIKALRILGNCFNPAGYEWTEEESAQVMGAVVDALESLRDAVTRQKAAGRQAFQFRK